MNTISKSQSTSPSSMRVNISSSDESTSPPWHAWELEAPASADEPWRQDQPDSGTPFSPLVDNSMSDAPEPEGAILNFAGTSELAQIYKEYNSHGYGQLAQFVLLDSNVFELNPLEPVPMTSSIYKCCSALFGSAVIAASPDADTTGDILLGMDISVVKEFIRNEYILGSPSGLAVGGRLVFFLEGKPCQGHVIECQISVPECVQITRVGLKYCPLCLDG
ncbi:unnamed protein product [Aspergillus oryzae]|uniref:Unnamed protein product n=1 Tax=Aspergillus oryzae var. brunneus TaxID=332754 RepID=A0ABQ6KXR9_ASPOZ|nr:unnamed protein product [Aspergillus oryzae]GMF96371.1 unnamed protein product [Aspergillus oryzae]GMG14753.1 unnamed protein product [Aspergillus oryzae]GMG48364.1 unnamed protein product [Aspergillus oryzae var. brunneus]